MCMWRIDDVRKMNISNPEVYENALFLSKGCKRYSQQRWGLFKGVWIIMADNED